MGKITLLDDSLANKIAAGEVVERPASIVKELVENSLDAESTSIQVIVEEGGLAKVKIVDNGQGIASDDCELAFQRHATSKIKNEQDLFHINTLGFRGEALPSIASVSHLEIKTCTGDGPGKHLVFQGGHLINSSSTSSRRGTEIAVTNLFFNTPARLKHLKTVHTELGNISDVLNKLALAHPDVSFSLIHNDKQMLHTNGNGDLAQVLAAIYGFQTAKLSLNLKAESLDFKINGRLVKPEITRAGRQYVYIFINGRYIRNYPIFNAIISGYHTLLPIGRFPIAVVHISMDPTLVDVNVHPAKLEARLSKEKELCELIEHAIKQVFHRLQLIPEVKHGQNKPFREKPEQQSFSFESHNSKQHSQSYKQENRSFSKDTNKQERHLDGRDYQFARSSQLMAGHSSLDNTLDIGNERKEDDDEGLNNETSSFVEADQVNEHLTLDDEEMSTNHSSEFEEKRMPVMYPIGQMHGTYILAQNEKGLYLIDQHAAQERIKYEFFREKLADVTNEVQELLVPITFEFTASEYSLIQEYEDFLKQIGIYFEPFGQHSLIIRSHPYWLPKGHEKEMIEEVVEQLIQNQKISVLKLREKLAIMMACKKSIKANRHLREDEIQALLEELRKAKDPFTCPHGRPVIVHFSTYEMEKMFKRVM